MQSTEWACWFFGGPVILTGATQDIERMVAVASKNLSTLREFHWSRGTSARVRTGFLGPSRLPGSAKTAKPKQRINLYPAKFEVAMR